MTAPSPLSREPTKELDTRVVGHYPRSEDRRDLPQGTVMADSVTRIKRRHRVEAKRLRGECRYCHRPAAPFTRCEKHRREAAYWKGQYGR